MRLLRRNTQLGIEHDAQQSPAALEAAAIGEKRIVGDDRADASKQRVGAWRMRCTSARDSSDVTHARFGSRFFPCFLSAS